MAGILEILQESAQLRFQINAVKRQFVGLVNGFAPPLQRRDFNLVLDLNLRRTAADLEADVINGGVLSGKGEMDSCFTDSRCPVKLFNFRSASVMAESANRDGRSTGSNSADVNTGSTVFNRHVRSGLNRKSVNLTATNMSLSQRRSAGDHKSKHRRERDRNHSDGNKENAAPVSWLPPSGMVKSAPKRTATSTFEISNASSVASEKDNLFPSESSDRVELQAAGGDYLLQSSLEQRTADGCSQLTDDEEPFPSSLSDISVISRCSSNYGTVSNHANSAVGHAINGHLERSGFLVSSTSSLKGAFCSSFNANEPAFCSTFSYPLHSTFAGQRREEEQSLASSSSSLDLSALVAEQERQRRDTAADPDNGRGRQQGDVIGPKRIVNAVESANWASTNVDDENVPNLVSADAVPADLDDCQPLCCRCGFFHSQADITGSCRQAVLRQSKLVACDNLTSSANCQLAQPQSEKSLQLSIGSWPSTLSGTAAGWSSSKNDTDLTDGRLRRQMGHTRLDPGNGSEEVAKSTHFDDDGVFSEVTSLITEPEVELSEEKSKIKWPLSPSRRFNYDAQTVRSCNGQKPADAMTAVIRTDRQPETADPVPAHFSEVNVVSVTDWLKSGHIIAGNSDTMFRRPMTPIRVSRFHRRTAEHRAPSPTRRSEHDRHNHVTDECRKSSQPTDCRPEHCMPATELAMRAPTAASVADRRRTWTPASGVSSKRSRCDDHQDCSERHHRRRRRRYRGDGDDRSSLSATHHQHPTTYVATSSTSATSAISLASSSTTALSCRGNRHQTTETSTTSSWNKYCDDSITSRQRKRALVRKLRRFSDALYGSTGGLQLKIFGHV